MRAGGAEGNSRRVWFAYLQRRLGRLGLSLSGNQGEDVKVGAAGEADGLGGVEEGVADVG
jgi:hypothetical protein